MIMKIRMAKLENFSWSSCLPKTSSSRVPLCLLTVVTFFLIQVKIIAIPEDAFSTLSVDEINGCIVTNETEKDIEAKMAFKQCYNETNPENFTDFSYFTTYPPLEDVYDENDNCLAYCYYKNMQLLTEDGKFRKNNDAVSPFGRTNATKKMTKRVIDYWNNCVDEVDHISKIKDWEYDICKCVFLVDYCFDRKLEGSTFIRFCEE